MILNIIGCYCIIHVIIGEIAIISSVIDKDDNADGARARANFINIGYLAIAAWCFK